MCQESTALAQRVNGEWSDQRKVMGMKRRTIEITAELIEEEEGGYTVYCPELDIYTQGEDVEDALANLREAAQLHIEEVGPQNLKLRKVERQELTLEVHA